MRSQAVPSELHPRLADRLAAARRGRFVGRLAELELFRSALLAAEAPFAVLHISGPGGVGKTTLLREYGRLAADSGRTVVHLDGRQVDPTPPGFLLALRRAMGLPGNGSVPAAPEWPPAGVLLMDTYEILEPLDTWLRDEFLPHLPARSLVVIAGRQPPAAAWRTDLEWADLTRIVALGNLRSEESQTYLTTRGVPADQHAEVLAFTHGHPLALALVADALGRGNTLAVFDPRREPDIVRLLLERLVREVPTPEHRRALETCVLAWVTTESLLAEVLDVADAHDLFEWLRRQSFIEQGSDGLFPHDLAREALDADLGWRSPTDRRQLSQRLSACMYARLRHARGAEQQRLWAHMLFLLRRNPFYRPIFAWSGLGTASTEPVMPADHETILDMVRRHEGEASADIVRHWLRRQPEAMLACRDAGGDVFGFLGHPTIHAATPEDIAADPAVAAALCFVERHGPIRPGEEIVYHRFFMSRDAYQGVSPVINLAAITSSIDWTTNPKLAWNFMAVADPDFFEPVFTSIHIWRSPEADFEVGGRHYGVFAHDWRVEPAAVWLEVKAAQTAVTDRDLAPSPASPPPGTVSRAEFAAAVRQALRDNTRPDRLAANPLTRSRLIPDVAGQETAAALLQGRLRDAVASLTANPKDAKRHRALWHTYVEPAPTQELAAELLGLPFNTYRYHLAKGIERVTDWLWRREGVGVNR